MKNYKYVYKAALVLMVIISLTLLFTGCTQKEDTDENERDEYIFIPEYIALPRTISNMGNVNYSNGKLYFTDSIYNSATATYSMAIYSIDIDGTNQTKLEDYAVADPPEGADIGHTQIGAMYVEPNGNLWIIEVVSLLGFDLPDDYDEEKDPAGKWAYYTEIGSMVNLRKLDETGRELEAYDISEIVNINDIYQIRSLLVDDAGNIYIADNSNVYVLDNTGILKFRLESPGWIGSLIKMPDDSIVASGQAGSGRILLEIDVAAQQWGETISLPLNALNTFAGSGDYSILFKDFTNLYGLDKNTHEYEKLLSWIDSDIISDGINNVIFLPDGRLLCINTRYNYRTGAESYELII